jgi:16S rRNA (adenine1518-N6/adenine1519-N6)-dimethyltransferase
MKALLERHGLYPRAALGQHFLADPNITRKVVATARIGQGDQVLEIGAGTGTLTRALAEAGARVIAYEVDPRLEPVLAESLAGLGVEVHIADATGIDFQAVLGEGRWKLVANLPYNVGTPLLLEMIRKVPRVSEFTVMVQLEVGLRLTAPAGTPEYGIPSVVAQIYTDPHLVFRIPPQVFFPAPRVESAVVHLVRKPAPPTAERAIELAASGFGQRRKMLRRSLATVFSTPEQVLASAGIEPTRRAEDLQPADYLRLAEVADD